MFLIKPKYEIITPLDREGVLKRIELIGRVCWKSEDKIKDGSASKFCSMILGKNHLSVIEHVNMTVKFTVDRGVTHELVRHRLCSFTQESTRYVNFTKNDITFIIPLWVDIPEGEYRLPSYFTEILEHKDNNTKMWFQNCFRTERDYCNLIREGWTPQQARCVLSNSLKAELYVTANLRQWRHIFELRCDMSAHPQMREIMIPLRDEMRNLLPEIFG